MALDVIMKPKNKDQKKPVRPRIKLFRALGVDKPPLLIEINNQSYHWVYTYKHDSWAATALYKSHTCFIVCKFNRQQSIFGIPMKWLGNVLARRENRFLHMFHDIPSVPQLYGPISLNSKVLSHVSAHGYVEGVPLRQYKDTVKDDFFPKLQQILKNIHDKNVSYMDLDKKENILVDKNGEPHLIDFQICFHLPNQLFFLKWWLHVLQKLDDYHLMKHYTRLRPDLFTPEELKKAQKPPFFLHIVRCLQIPIRKLRRKLLTLLKYRDQTGLSNSELFIEEGKRNK